MKYQWYMRTMLVLVVAAVIALGWLVSELLKMNFPSIPK